MREIHHAITDINVYLEEAARARQQHDADRWRQDLRPGAMRLFATRTVKLPWSRPLLQLVVDELYPDDLFTELIGNLDRVPSRQWPRVLAIAVALRCSWRRDGLARVARRLRVSLAASHEASSHTPRCSSDRVTQQRRSTPLRCRPSRTEFCGSPRPRQGSPLRFDPARRGSRP
jgi:hypothetical protein